MIDRLNKVNDSEDDDSVIFQILGNNPYRRPRAWVALGDSFAAGPGAGDSVNDGSACQRGTDAYPFLIQADPSTPGGGARQFTFKACTGDITTNLMDPQNPNYQLGPVRDSTTFTTLSIGGNDIGFSTILLQCVFNIGGTSCDVVVQRARDSLYGQTVHHNYMDLLGQIVERLDWDQRDDMRTVIYQTGYPQFFDDDTTQCNSAKFSPAGVYVTQHLRRDLNQLSEEANYMLQYWVAVFNVGHTQDPDDQRRFGAAVNFAELDFMYANHRLCRQGVNEPDRRTLDTWFYHLLASRRHLGETQVNSSSNGSIETAEADLDKYFDQPSANASTIPEWLSKTFHPTPQGMDATHQYMVTLKLRYRQGIRNIGGATIDLMVIGDYVLFASQDPNSDIYQGIIPHLVSIFGDRRFYGYPDNTRPLATLNFFGSQQPPYLNARAHECYQTANLRQLGDNLAASADISLQRKVVLLMAGTIDLFNQVDNDNAPARLGEIIDLIFDRDPYAAVIVSQIPMIGIGGDGSIENGLQRRIALYNARVANIVARMQRQGRRILKIHPSATPLEHSDGDFILPNTRGYLRMAFDFAEAIVWAYGLEWATSSGASTPLPGPPSPPGTDDKNVGVVICEQYRSWGNSQGEPTTDEIMKSILRNYNDEDEFISKAACNVTEICKWANNGFVCSPTGTDILMLVKLTSGIAWRPRWT